VKPNGSQSTSAAHEYACLTAVARELKNLEQRLDELEDQMRESIAHVPEEHREGARNLVHYISLRQHDLRELQQSLAQLGLSSLGRSESCVRANLLEVSRRVHEALAIRGDANAKRELARLEKHPDAGFAWQAANEYLHQHTRGVLGPRPENRHIYIMVTAPSAQEATREWMLRMLRAGMNVLRINSAHEGPNQWKAIVESLNEARRETAQECRVLVDLAGPKIRTGRVAGPCRIATWKPTKDKIGRIIAPARVVVRRDSAFSVEDGESTTLALNDRAFSLIRRGDELRFNDARGKKRSIETREVRDDEVVGYATRRAYVVDRASARVVRAGKQIATIRIEAACGEGAAIDIKAGDELLLTGRSVDGQPPRRDRQGRITKRGVIACTLPAALQRLEVGHRVLFDDGRIGAVVEKVDTKHADYFLRISRTQKQTVWLRAEKGINLPDTAIPVSSLTEEAASALTFAAQYAAAVGLSFVREREDVRRLHAELDRLGRRDIGVVLKIETRAGFENLPRLLLEGLRRPPLAVMIARGDLAIEVGFERLAELQEEILWLCEASHVPVIWATQVLDSLARTGTPSRAEVTDAAASVAAECVMLNKGPFIDEAVRVLSNILRRMEKHRYKKRSLLRKLRVSNFVEAKGPAPSWP
jgi:pyruvate kinase